MIRRVYAWMRKWWKFFALSVLLSGLFGLQHIILLMKYNDNYNPLPIAGGNAFLLEEAAYVANIKSVMEGNYASSGAHIEGKKGVTNSMEAFPNLVLGILSMIFWLDIRHLVVLADFILPVIAVWLYYLIGSQVLRMQRTFAFFVSLFIVILVHDIPLWDIVWNIATFNVHYFFSYWIAGRDMFTITRLMHPEFTILPMLLSIILLYFSVSHGRKMYLYPVLAGISAGLLAYSYFYYTTFFWALFAALGIIMLLEGLLERKWEKNVWRNLVIVGCIGSVLSVPFVVKMMRNASLPQAQEMLLRVGASFGREPNMFYIIAAMAIVPLLYIAYYNQSRNAFRLLGAAIVGGALLLNIQVILGYTIQPDHWASRIVNPLLVMAVAGIAHEACTRWLGRKIVVIRYASVVGGALLLLLCAFVQAEVAVEKGGIYTFSQGEKELYQWLDANTPKESTVLTISIEQNQNLQLYTHNSIYWPNAMTHNLPTEEVIDRILSAYAIFNVSEENVWKRFDGMARVVGTAKMEDAEFVYYLFHFQFRMDEWESTVIPASFREEIAKKRVSGNFTPYNVDYILVDSYAERFADASSIRKKYREVYSNGEFSLFDAKTK